jgi:hypothetical protein
MGSIFLGEGTCGVCGHALTWDNIYTDGSHHAALCRAELFTQVTRLTFALHDRRAHPDFEYATTKCARKSESFAPEGEGWERNITTDVGDAQTIFGTSWNREDFHEDHYWRRRKPKAGT